jgi:small-conductance mechanosensitive channel
MNFSIPENFPWQGGAYTEEIVSSIILVATTMLLRIAMEKALRRKAFFITEKQWRVISKLKTASFLIIAVGLFVIWAPSLRSLALSLTAFAVAIIIATKELIMCLSGSVVRVVSNAANVGDWVELNGVRGQVVDVDVFSTTLQEIHSDGRSYEFTGRRVTVPNAVYLSLPVRNETFYGHYVYHKFSMVFLPNIDFEHIERLVQDSLTHDMEPHIELARRYNAALERKSGLDLQDVDPEIKFETTIDANIKMNVVAFLPTRKAVKFEQNAIRAALSAITKESKAAENP